MDPHFFLDFCGWNSLGSPCKRFFPSTKMPGNRKNELIVFDWKLRISWAPKLQFLGFLECFPKRVTVSSKKDGVFQL